MSNTNETVVTQNYTRTQNVSVTVRDGRIDRVTVWTTGQPRSTRVLAETPMSLRGDAHRLAQSKVFKSRKAPARV